MSLGYNFSDCNRSRLPGNMSRFLETEEAQRFRILTGLAGLFMGLSSLCSILINGYFGTTVLIAMLRDWLPRRRFLFVLNLCFVDLCLSFSFLSLAVSRQILFPGKSCTSV